MKGRQHGYNPLMSRQTLRTMARMPLQYTLTRHVTRTHSTLNVTSTLLHLIPPYLSRTLIRPSVCQSTVSCTPKKNTLSYSQFETSLAMISQSFALQSVNQLVSSSNLTSLLSISPQTAITPIWFTINNLLPFNVPV